MTPKTISLLRQVQRQLDKNPEGFHMGVWNSSSTFVEKKSMACQTTMCIGGWAAHLKGIPFVSEDGSEHYMDVLELTPDEASRLFFEQNWPGEFKWAYRSAEREDNHEAMVGVTNRRIDHFINTNGRE
jgi:hypothetical protein